MNWLTPILSAFSKPLKWWVIVAPWERGLRVRLGRKDVLLEPGPHFRIPFVDRIYVQSIRLRAISDMNQDLTTRDGKPLTVSYAIEFSIGDLRRVYETFTDPEAVLLARAGALAVSWAEQTPMAEATPSALLVALQGLGSWEDRGLQGVTPRVIGFARAKPYRILSTDYRNVTGLKLEKDKGV